MGKVASANAWIYFSRVNRLKLEEGGDRIFKGTNCKEV
jgi:hypothetical protein